MEEGRRRRGRVGMYLKMFSPLIFFGADITYVCSTASCMLRENANVYEEGDGWGRVCIYIRS
jgi:hypothetical protein